MIHSDCDDLKRIARKPKDPPRGRDVPKTPVGRVLLRLTEFILPPPHPSVKERLPRGGLSYDQIHPRVEGREHITVTRIPGAPGLITPAK